MRCHVKNCRASIKANEHDTCPYHAPCHEKGEYVPDKCRSCRIHLDALENMHPDDRANSPLWPLAESIVRHLRQAVDRAPHLDSLVVRDARVLAWFPRAAMGSQSYNEWAVPRTPGRSLSDPSPTRAPQAPMEPDQAYHPTGHDMPSRVARMEQSLEAILARLPPVDPVGHRSRSASSSSTVSSRHNSRSPPRKAPRHTAPPTGQGSAARTRIYSSSSVSTEDIDDEDSSDTEPEPSGSSTVPSAGRGWQPTPSDWIVKPVNGTWVAHELIDKEKEPSLDNLLPLNDYDIYTCTQGADTTHYFRPRAQPAPTTRTPRERASLVPAALASMSVWVKGAPAPCPSVSLAGSGRRTDGCVIKDVTLSPALGLSALPTLWAARAAGDKSSNLDRDEARHDPKPTKQVWPKGSAEDKTNLFLQDSTLDHATPPAGLTTPSAATVKKDKDGRAAALRLLQVSANVDVLSCDLRAAASSGRAWTNQDIQTLLSSTATVLEGISSLLAPVTRDKVREAVTQRVALREEAIPKDLASIKPQLLNLDPLSPYLYGPREVVSNLISSRPPPATVEIKGLDKMNNMWRSWQGQGQTKGNGNRPSNSKSQSGGGKNKGSNQNRSQNHSKQPAAPKKPFHKSGGGGNHKSNHKSPTASSSSESKSSSKKN